MADGNTACGLALPVVELIATKDEHAITEHLGPDPLRDDWDLDEATRRLLLRPERALAAALLDQRNLAGLGNLWVNETCFLRGHSPWTPVGEVDVTATVRLAAKMLRYSAFGPSAAQVTTGVARPGQEHWVTGAQTSRADVAGLRSAMSPLSRVTPNGATHGGARAASVERGYVDLVNPDTARPHVVVIGGGFGGIAAVRALRDSPVDVTLVDRNAYNTFQPLLYQVATAALNPGDITYFLRALRARQRNVRVRKAAVTAIDPPARTVHLENDETLSYDYLIIATGVTTNYFDVPGAVEHGLALYTRVEALAVRDRLLARLEQAARDPEQRGLSIVIVGGGATGVEMAGSLAELRNTAQAVLYPELDPSQTHIVLVEMSDQLLTPFMPRLRRYTARALTKRGVRLRLKTAVKEVRGDGVVVDDGEFIPAGLVIWATGIKAPDVVTEWGLHQGKGGRILVDDDLRVRGFDNVFAVGDIALTAEPLPQVAQPAMQGGKHAGRQVAALVSGGATVPFHYWDKGLLATIGRSSAVAQIKHVPGFTGFPAWLIWLGIHIVYLLDNRNRFATFVNLAVRYVFWPRHLDAIVGEVPTPDRRPRRA